MFVGQLIWNGAIFGIAAAVITIFWNMTKFSTCAAHLHPPILKKNDCCIWNSSRENRVCNLFLNFQVYSNLHRTYNRFWQLMHY